MMHVTRSRCLPLFCVMAMVAGLFAGTIGRAAAQDGSVEDVSVEEIYAPFKAVTAMSLQSPSGQELPKAVATLALDDAGRVWAGGYGTLFKFDGAHTEVFSPKDTPLLEEGFVRALLPMENGDVLVGTNREGVLRWRQRSGTLEQVVTSDGLLLSRINALAPAPGGGAWIGAEQGLFLLSEETGRLTRVRDPLLQAAQSPRVMNVLQRADGALWVAAHTGVLVRGKDKARFAPLRIANAELQARVANETTWTLAEDASGRVWIGLVRSGIVVIGPGEAAFAPKGLDGVQGLHQGRTIRTFLWHAGQMWMGTDGAGLLACSADCAQARTVAVSLGLYERRRNFFVRSLVADAAGRIWAASDRGVFHFQPQPRGVFELDLTPPDGGAEQDSNETRSVMYDSRGRIWVGQFDGEVMLLDLAKGTRRQLILPPPLRGSSVDALHEDRDGKVWVVGRGVGWVDPDTLQVRPAGKLAGEPITRYSDIDIEGDRVWLTHYDGLIEATLDGTVLRRLQGTTGTGLLTSHLTSVATQGNHLWLGTPLGLHRLDLQTWTATVEGPTPAASPRAPYISAISQEPNEAWAATMQGLWRLGSTGQPPQAIEATAGLAVLDAMPSAAGVWFATEKSRLGFFRQGAVRYFRAFEGVEGSTGYTQRGMVAGPAGTVLISSGLGLTVIDPARLLAQPDVVVDLAPRVVAISVDGSVLKGESLPGKGQRLELAPEQERLSIEFSTPNYLSMGGQRFAYQLQGYDSDWVEVPVGTAPAAVFGRIPAGDYQLALRVSHVELPDRAWVKHIPVHVRPFWYQRSDVRLLAVLLLLVAVILVIRLRDMSARRQRRRLEHLVTQRTSELEHANQRLDRLAGEDALTGLYNRRRLFQRLQELAKENQRYPRTDTLMLLDFDHFKRINDSFGHQAGDQVLSECARRIATQLRAQDFAGRYGGEELMIVLPRTNHSEAQAVVHRVRNVLRNSPVAVDGREIWVTVSIGVAESNGAESPDHWVARADRALYRAKADGRDCVRLAATADAGPDTP